MSGLQGVSGVFYIHCKKCGIELTEEHRATMTGDDKPGRVDSLDGGFFVFLTLIVICLLYTSPSPRDATLSRMPSSA